MEPRSNPFAAATEAAAAAASDTPSGASPVATAAAEPLPAGSKETEEPATPHKRPAARRRLLSCACLAPRVADDEHPSELPTPRTLSPRHSHKKAVTWRVDGKPARPCLRSSSSLKPQGSAAYSNADWHDARSEFSSALSGALMSDSTAKLEEVSAMVRELAPLSAPWVPDTPLVFGERGLQFIPVPAVTGFAAYWERDEARSTPSPLPVDVMKKAGAIVMRVHASVAGLLMQETASTFTMAVRPRFMPPGIPRYTESYDKTNATEPAWRLRRDMRPGSTSGRIFMTACGMLILQVRTKPLFGGEHDYVSEEYMRLEEGGAVLVDRMCCQCLKTGQRAVQYVVARRLLEPPKGSI